VLGNQSKVRRAFDIAGIISMAALIGYLAYFFTKYGFFPWDV